MKYKINYKKNKTFVNKLDSNFKFLPIIKNNFFDYDTNKRFKDLYLDFDYYYHRDGYNNETWYQLLDTRSFRFVICIQTKY